MRTAFIIAALLLASPAAAADPDTLTAEEKALYLKCAYVLSGHTSRAIIPTIDLSDWSKEELDLCIEPQPFAEAAPEPKPALAKADRPVSDVCTRAGMRKVYTDSGTSWRCRK